MDTACAHGSVHAILAGSGEQIKETVIGVNVFGREAYYDAPSLLALSGPLCGRLSGTLTKSTETMVLTSWPSRTNSPRPEQPTAQPTETDQRQPAKPS